MTRSEEIQRKAGSIADGMKQHYAPQTECKGYYEGFIEGAKWADRTILDKVCKWVDDIDFDMEYWNCEDGFCKEMFINAFKKAMEE